jgi:hypothetical protein
MDHDVQAGGKATLVVLKVVRDVPNTAEIKALRNYGIVTRPFVEKRKNRKRGFMIRQSLVNAENKD